MVWYNTQVVERKGIEVNFKRSLVEVKPDKREAVFQVLEEDTTETYSVSTAASLISHAPSRNGKGPVTYTPTIKLSPRQNVVKDR